MKKHLILFLLITLSAFIIACGGNNSSDGVTPAVDITDTIAVSQPKHSFYGMYQGLLPCANCTGIQTIIQLMEDGTYTKRFIYLGRGSDEVQIENGTFTWNPDGTLVTLTGPSATIQYIVGPNNITQLNENGQPYQGSNAGQYTLNRAEDVGPTYKKQD